MPQICFQAFRVIPKHKDIIYVLLLVFVLFSYLSYQELKFPNYFLNDDNANQFLPYYTYNWRSVVENKTIPLINFHQYLGHTYLGQGQSGVLYPPAYLAVGISYLFFQNPFSAIDILIFLHFAVSVTATFYLLRRLSVSANISTLCSLIWITMPLLITASRAWVNISYLAAYLPLNFLTLDYFIKKPSLKSTLLLSIVKALLFYQGYIQHAFMVIIAELLFITALFISQFHDPSQRLVKKTLLYYFFSFIFLSALIAPQLFPLLSAQSVSYYRSKSLPFDEFMYGSITPNLFFESQTFHFIPRTMHGASSKTIYVGPFLIALLGLTAIKSIKVKLWKTQATPYLFVAISALLVTTDLYKFLYYIPIFKLFRWPFKYYFLFLFFTVVSVAIASQTISNGKKTVSKLAIYALLLLSLLLNILINAQTPFEVFGSWRINQPPQITHLNSIIKNQGRVFTYKIDAAKQYSYPFLSFDYATLFDQFHFGGYDPLVSKLNYQLSLQLDLLNSFQSPITPELLAYLSQWSTKYIVADNTISNKNEFSSHSLEIIHEDSQLIVGNNSNSLPFVRTNSDPTTVVPFQFHTNALVIYPTTQTSHTLLVAIAPLKQFHVFADDQLIGRVRPNNGPIQVSVPSHANKITIRFIDYSFIFGCLIFIIFWTVLPLGLITEKIYWHYKRTTDHYNSTP